MPMTRTTAAAMLERAGVDRARVGEVMPRVDPDAVVVRVASSWFRRLWARGITGVTMPWGVYVHPDVMGDYEAGRDLDHIGSLIAHELMHVEQLARLGVVAHSAQYLADYVRERLAGRRHWDAYRAVRLEQEARAAARLVTDAAG
jgi:hypothetical protein